jgi:hypothetical protein
MASRRINAVTGTNKTDLESAYMTSPLTTTQIGNVNFTRSMIIDNMVGVVGDIVKAYANTRNHPFRAYNLTQTASILNRGAIPSVNSSGVPMVGAYGAIRDASTGKVLTKQPAQLIESILIGMADDSVKGTYYMYDIVDNRLIHTVVGAVIDICTYSVSAQLTSVAANGDAPIPDALLDLAWIGLVSTLMIDDEFVSQAAAHRSAFDQGTAELMAGGTPAPTMTASAAPTIS